ncbi:hypothetical protein DFH27DRAFT_617404 [Peziza echinospora]|nr:hypothetical protein DFH27DRAFT_617404 [Peziza echinospora]
MPPASATTHAPWRLQPKTCRLNPSEIINLLDERLSLKEIVRLKEAEQLWADEENNCDEETTRDKGADKGDKNHDDNDAEDDDETGGDNEDEEDNETKDNDEADENESSLNNELGHINDLDYGRRHDDSDSDSDYSCSPTPRQMTTIHTSSPMASASTPSTSPPHYATHTTPPAAPIKVAHGHNKLALRNPYILTFSKVLTLLRTAGLSVMTPLKLQIAMTTEGEYTAWLGDVGNGGVSARKAMLVINNDSWEALLEEVASTAIRASKTMAR